MSETKMNAQEIIDKVSRGETVKMSISAWSLFMERCARYNIRCRVYVNVEDGACTISKKPVPVRREGHSRLTAKDVNLEEANFI